VGGCGRTAAPDDPIVADQGAAHPGWYRKSIRGVPSYQGSSDL